MNPNQQGNPHEGAGRRYRGKLVVREVNCRHGLDISLELKRGLLGCDQRISYSCRRCSSTAAATAFIMSFRLSASGPADECSGRSVTTARISLGPRAIHERRPGALYFDSLHGVVRTLLTMCF
jgi:hypothetical protein